MQTGPYNSNHISAAKLLQIPAALAGDNLFTALAVEIYPVQENCLSKEQLLFSNINQLNSVTDSLFK